MSNQANTYLEVTELDFSDIRSNLKSYLRTQSQFSDYDFEGSAISTLLDVLSYNTHYNAYYLNMVANEMFLDTAQQRDSVVSRARELGYTPVSSLGASSEVKLKINGIAAGVSQVTVPKNSKFTTTVDDITYTFVTPQAEKIDISSSGLFEKNIKIKEGEPLSHSWTVSASNPVRYIIPNPGVDTNSITVSVQESSSDTTSTDFKLATNIDQVFSTSAIYFIEEAADKKYEIIFGSGSLGKSLSAGNIVKVEYLVNNAEATNGANTFSIDSLTLDSGISYSSAVIMSVVSKATGGREQETIDSIKFAAPRNYQTQNRAVVAEDYERILLSENSDLQSVIAYGGEDENPPQNGKVIIATKPFGESFITSNRKNEIKVSIKNRTPLAIDPVIVDPEYIYLVPAINTFYDLTKSSLTAAAVESNIRQAITEYSTQNLERFGNKFRYSRFVRSLDNTSGGYILNNDASIKMQKRITPATDFAQSISLEYHNPVVKKSLTSSDFVYSGSVSKLEDDGNGVVNIVRTNSDNTKTIVVANAGTIDYTIGKIFLPDFFPSSYSNLEMTIDVEPQFLDVSPTRKQILLMQANDARITVFGEQT